MKNEIVNIRVYKFKTMCCNCLCYFTGKKVKAFFSLKVSHHLERYLEVHFQEAAPLFKMVFISVLLLRYLFQVDITNNGTNKYRNYFSVFHSFYTIPSLIER